jgi:hypothetical protein
VTNQNADAQPPKQPSPTIAGVGRSSAGTGAASGSERAARDSAPRRSGALLLAVLVLITAAFAFVMLSPDKVRRWIGNTPPPSTTISVAPPGASAPPSAGPAPNAPRAAAPAPSAPSSAPRPPAAPSTAPAGSAELQALRDSLGDVNNRLGALEQKATAGGDSRVADLENRLAALDGRVAGLIDQPVVTPAMLADALTENRQAAQAAAQEAAHDAAQQTVQQTVQAALQDMSRAVAELQKRTEAVEKSATSTAALADLDRRLAAVEKMASAVASVVDLERRMSTMEKAVPAVVAIPDLERRLANVEKIAAPLTAISQTALQGESLALGLLSIRTALDRGLPYADVLSALRVTASSDPVLNAEMERLAPFAGSGVPTMAVLRRRLAALPAVAPANPPPSSAAEPASPAPTPERGFWGEVWDRLSSTVTVRRLDANAAQTTPQGQAQAAGATLIERALQRLAFDDLAGAVALLESDAAMRDFSGAQSAALDDWLRDARGRLTAETSFINLARRSLALHGSAAAATTPASVSTAPAPTGTAPSGDASRGP